VSELAECAASTPVLIGVGLVSQRAASAATAHEALTLMRDAARAAGGDLRGEQLLARVERVYVPQGRWAYRDPGRAIADAIGAFGATTVLARVGVLQERLLADAAERIAAGELGVALVVGGDAGYRLTQARRAGLDVRDSRQETEPDEIWRPSGAIVTEAEMASGLGIAAPGYYAIIETAARHRAGRGAAEWARSVDELYRSMSRVAAGNPHAWTRCAVNASDLAPSPANPIIATPFTRAHCSNWSVDQASALLLCSARVARDAGVPADQWVFPLASGISEHMVPLTARADLHAAGGIRLAADAALGAAGLARGQLDLVDVYSCYPPAIRAHAEALGLAPDGPVTVTGGMRFAGGPFNNYVLHATGQLALRLRAGAGRFGAVTSVSGMLTKDAIGVWGTVPSPEGFQLRDVTSAVARHTVTREVGRDLRGRARIVGYTVLHGGGVPTAAVAVLENRDAVRVIARCTHPDVIRDFVSMQEQCGRDYLVEDGTFRPSGADHGR
jgi:acetyl-CoA C-acetyltransferase